MGILRELLSAEEPLFSASLRQLEAVSGHDGRDARLIADIAVRVRQGIVALRLDPSDTTGLELFSALKARIENDNRRLQKLFNIVEADEVIANTEKLVVKVRKSKVALKGWALKRPAAKRLLKHAPPSQLMKGLGYRSVDSLLKHEPIEILMVAVRFTEDEKWKTNYLTAVSHLTSSEFEARDVSVLALNEKYSAILSATAKEKPHDVVHSKEMGVVGLVAVPGSIRKGFVVLNLIFLLHYIAEVRSYSAFFKLRQVDKKFGDLLAKTLSDDEPLQSEVAGHLVHWRVVHRFFGSVHDGEHPELFEPHLQPEDLMWLRAEHMLEKIDPEMGFWVGKDYVGTVKDGRVTSFNLLDICLAYTQSVNYEDFSAMHFRDCLWNELFARYLGTRTLQSQILRQLDRAAFLPQDI